MRSVHAFIAPVVFVITIALCLPAVAGANASKLAKQVTIHRDQWGVPHIEGPTDEAVTFGLGYAQAEDYWWQIEEVYLRALGRHAEMVGDVRTLQFWPEGVTVDILSRAFEVAKRSKADFPGMSKLEQDICESYAAGVNYYLETHPEVKPAVLDRIEPWMVVAMGRFTMLEWAVQRTGISFTKQSQFAESLRKERGSNFWAIGPQKTKDGTTMLFVNPHQPFYGPGQFWEAHIKSDSGWHFSGSTFFGAPVLTMGHNEHLGWAHTANQPRVGDLYKVIFDDPKNPLNYRYDGGYRTAEEWTETIRVKTDSGFEDRTYTFRKTHHGPIVEQVDDQTYLACNIAQIFVGDRVGQAVRMSKATNFSEWLDAVSERSLVMFNIAYADREGNIFYLYNGAVPRRDHSLEWGRVMDGSDPRAEWHGLHSIDELPQILNPEDGWFQNCNESPFMATDNGAPYYYSYPEYMVGEGRRDNRRAQVSRWRLRQMEDVTFEDWEAATTDTTVYWAMYEFPRLWRQHEALYETDPKLAKAAEPYVEFLKEWDYKVALDDARSTLCYYWYEEMYGMNPPPDRLKAKYMDNPDQKFQALVDAADALTKTFGNWKVPYGDVFRMQRHAKVSNYMQIPFDDSLPSVPCAGIAGTLGGSYNVYYSFSTPDRAMRYGVQGGSFMAVYEFGKDRIKAKSVLQYGNSGDPESPHYFDQAQLYSKRQYKDAWFYWDDVLANAQRSYRPGE